MFAPSHYKHWATLRVSPDAQALCAASRARRELGFTYIVTKEGDEAAFIKSPVTFLAEIYMFLILKQMLRA